MTQVFISYTRRGDYDRQFADYLRGQITAWGYRPWMDVYDIPSGDHWDDAIDAALKSSDIVLGLMTPASVDSDNVKNEWAWALQKDKLHLLYLAPCDVPHRFVRIDYIDFTKDQNAGMARLHKILSTPSLHSSTTSTGARQAFKRISNTVRAVPGSAVDRVNKVAATSGLPRGLLIGGLIGVGLVVFACIAIILAAALQNNPLGLTGNTGNNVSNAEAFVSHIFVGNVAGAANLTCPEFRTQLSAEISQAVLELSSLGGVEASNLSCHELSSSEVACNYNLFSPALGITEPVSIELPMKDGLICTSTLAFIGAAPQQQFQ